jgi:hypothetical protein
LLLKSDKPSYVQYVDESRTDWYFTVVSRGGEIGLITAHDLKTGEIIELGRRLNKCIFVKPEEYADLIEELEVSRDNPKEFFKMASMMAHNIENEDYIRGWKEALSFALQLVIQRANPQPGIE